jgi:hypothetical protein
MQRLESGLPQFGQNFLPDVLSVPHLEQRMLIAQLVQQRLGVFQIRGIETFGKPVVDLWEHCACMIAAVGISQQPREAHRRA